MSNPSDNLWHSPIDGNVYSFGGEEANCTISVCPIELSVYGYRPSLPFSAALLALYGLAIAVHVFLGVRYKKWGFMTAMVLGCVTEMIGYAGRILYNQNPWAEAGFIIQIGTSSYVSLSRERDLTGV